MTITLAASYKSVMRTPVLTAMKEFIDPQAGVAWANEQAWRWIRNNAALATTEQGKFTLDGFHPKLIESADPDADVPLPLFASLRDELFISANNGEELFFINVDEATIEAGGVNTDDSNSVELFLTAAEATALREKLGMLMEAANGVDIFLGSDGSDAEDECFLDCDEEAHYRLGTVLEKLGGTFQPHRTENFKG